MMILKALLLAAGTAGAVLSFTRAKFPAPNQAGALSGKPLRNTVYKRIDAFIEAQAAQLNLPGAALAIVEGDQIVHLSTFGRARPGGEPPSPQTPFAIGSLTKSITALAVMQLVESGRVELDAPVQRYLPWFRVVDPQASAQMTVRHLLNQTSSLSQTVGMIPLADFDSSRDAVERQARTLATFRSTRAVGSAWEYSNMNYNLLGLIVEAASGESYDAYIRRHVFAPLDMRHSHTDQASAQQDGLAMGHRSWFGKPIAAPGLPMPRGSQPSGQLISSAEDMARFLIAYLNGGRYGGAQVLSSQGITEMLLPAVKATAMGIDMGAYGMGWFVEDTDKGTRVWHNGQAPDFFAYMVLLPDLKRGMVLLVNSNHMLLNFALVGMSEAAADLLSGMQPRLLLWGAIPWLQRASLLIPVIQAGGVYATLQRLRSLQLQPSRRPGRAHLWLLDISLPIVMNLVLAASALGLLSTNLRRFILLFLPDLSSLALLSGGFALIWTLARTGLIIRATYTDGAFQAPSLPDTRVGP